MIGQQDIDELASYDTLLAYCEHTLGAGHRRGTDLLFMCPYGSHQHPKLSIANKEGAGVFKCRACDIGGNIFALAAHLNGKDKKQDFRELCHLIADTTGTAIRDDEDGGDAKTRRRKQQKPAQSVQTPRTLSDTAAHDKRREIAFLDEAGITLARDCLRRARENAALMEQHADRLGIEARHLLLHVQYPERGGLGLTEDGRLCYIYTARDATGKLRPVAVKVRNTPGMEPRFMFLAGKPGVPYGVAAAEEHPSVIITEGESDALAIAALLEYYREICWQGREPEEGEAIAEEYLPAVIASPGTGGYANALPYLGGKRVLIVQDNDEAGERAATAFRDTLLPLAAAVNMWTPAPYKDAREACNSTPDKYPFILQIIERTLQ